MKCFPALLLLAVCAVAFAQFHYNDENPGAGFGPSTWSEIAAVCGAGVRQSPINIDESNTEYSDLVGPITFHYGVEDHGAVLNNGHTIEVEITEDAHTITGNGICGTNEAILAQFHFHWGQDDDEGSEHTRNGDAYPLEMHMVHYCSNYESLVDAIQSGDQHALVVLGVLFENGSGQDDLMDTLHPYLDEVEHHDDHVEIDESFSLAGFLTNSEDFFEYSGSLTTPTCNEVVHWFVIRDVKRVDDDTLERIRNAEILVTGDSTYDTGINFRPTQPLNGRVVRRNFAPDVLGSSSSASTLVVSGVLVVLLALALAL